MRHPRWIPALALLALAACDQSSKAAAPPAEEHAAAYERVDIGAGLRGTPPASWTAKSPSSSMRVAEYDLAGPGGTATLAVFHFGGEGGSVQDNLDRWRGQFQGPDGAAPKSETAELVSAAGLKVHEMTVEGRYVAAMMPGQPGSHDEEGWAMLAAVVETPQGSFYPKLVGPAETVRANEEAWRSFLDSLACP